MDLKNLNPQVNRIFIGGKYLLKERLGGGSFGQIYTAILPDDDKFSFAIKLEKRTPNGFVTLGREAQIISTLKGEVGFPLLYDFGKEQDYNYMAINLLGLSLEKLLKICGGKFSLKTVLMLGNQMLSRMETLHSKGYIHRDIKPENFCVGMGKGRKTLFLIDFGLARNFIDENGKHIPFKQDKGLVGTARYASINAHLGYELSRRDDLEEIGYILIYFLKGTLPWQNMKGANKNAKYQGIKDSKMTTSIDELCRGLPIEFTTFMSYAKGLGFADTPNYKFLKNLFKSLIVQNGWEVDYEFDWFANTKTETTTSLKTIDNPIIQTVHVRQYKNVGISTLEGEKSRVMKTDRNKTGNTQKEDQKIEDATEIKEALKNKKIEKVIRGLGEKLKNRVKNRKARAKDSKYELVTSYHTSKAINYTLGYVLEGDVPDEISIHNAPEDNLEQTMTLVLKKKDFSHGNILGFYSTESLEGLDQSPKVTPRSSDDLEKNAKDNQYKKSVFHQQKKGNEDFGENLSESSICEWDEGVNLAYKVKNQSLKINIKNKII